MKMKEKRVHIPNISYKRCIAIIERELRELKGVKSVWGDDEARSVSIWWERPATWHKIEDRLEAAGYPAG